MSLAVGHRCFYENVKGPPAADVPLSAAEKQMFQKCNLFQMQDKNAPGVEDSTLFGQRLLAYEDIVRWKMQVLGFPHLLQRKKNEHGKRLRELKTKSSLTKVEVEKNREDIIARLFGLIATLWPIYHDRKGELLLKKKG